MGSAEPTHLLEILTSYGFEGLDHQALLLLQYWNSDLPQNWVTLAVIEAIYQGRYKLVSVQQILRCWQRRGEPRTNFDWSFQHQIMIDNWQPLIPPIVDTPSLPTTLAVLKTVPPLRQPVGTRLRELVGVI